MRRLTLLLALLPPAAFAADKKPNVIVIIADDLGYGDVSCNGMGKIKTPAIDKLAAEGVRFTDGYVAASTCTPTRYSVMTGEYPWRKKGTGILPGDAALIISPSRITLPRIFKDAGYATAAIGKWHMGMGSGSIDFNKHISPALNELGFDYSFHMAATGDRVPCVFIENGNVVNTDPADPIEVNYKHKIGDWPTGWDHPELLKMPSPEGHKDTIINGIGRIGFMTGGKKALWDDRTMSDVFNAKAIDFIQRSKNKPFFLYYASHEPHVPRDPNPRFVGKTGMGPRADAILSLDEQVAKIMKTLKDEGIEDNTLVIFSSDNGPAVADGYGDGSLVKETEKGHTPSGVFRGGKYTDYEGGLHLPFIARWPDQIKPGATSAELVTLTDLAATAAALTGTTLPADAAPDSRNILPVLTSGAKSPHDFLLFGNPSPAMAPAAIREGKWKLVLRPGASGKRNPPNAAGADPKGKPQLFDLAADPSEKSNLAGKHPDIVARLTQQAAAAAAAGFTRPGAARAEVR